MKIYAFLLTETPNVWHREILGSLQEMGHRVFSPKNLGLSETWYRAKEGVSIFRSKEPLSQRLLEDVKRVNQREKLDLFFSYIFPHQFHPHVFKEIERRGIPTVLFYCDNLTCPTMAEETAKYFTLTWVPERKAVGLYQKRHRNYVYLPMAANPSLNRPLMLEEKREMLFLGGKTPYRRWLLGSLISRSFDLEIYGNYWRNGRTYYELDDPSQVKDSKNLSFVEKLANFAEGKRRSLGFLIRYGIRPRILKAKLEKLGEEYESSVTSYAFGPVTPERVIELYSESKVTLGINHYVDPAFTDLFHSTYSKARDFEAPMSGACYLTQHTEELDEFYPEKDTIMTYRSLEDLCEKAEILLNDQKLRDRMRVNARRFCVENHTWQHRFKVLFRKLGLKG